LGVQGVRVPVDNEGRGQRLTCRRLEAEDLSGFVEHSPAARCDTASAAAVVAAAVVVIF
jgi:hypothetical protein